MSESAVPALPNSDANASEDQTSVTVSAETPPLQSLDEDPIVPHMFTFREVESQFLSTYFHDTINDSAILDVIAIYIKGQRILYTEAKTLCEQRLNYLMLPAIFNTAVCTILSLVLKDYDYGSTIVSCLNGLNAFLLAVVSYLKLDARAEAHRNSAYKFDKISARTIFSSGRVLFGALKPEERQSKLIEIIEKVEKEVNEIKDSNHFVLPELVRMTYPRTYESNIFAEVKNIMNEETVVMNFLRRTINDREVANVEYQVALKTNNESTIANAKKVLDAAKEEYNSQLTQCIRNRKTYSYLDKELAKELRDIVYKKRCCSWLNPCNFFKN